MGKRSRKCRARDNAHLFAAGLSAKSVTVSLIRSVHCLVCPGVDKSTIEQRVAYCAARGWDSVIFIDCPVDSLLDAVREQQLHAEHIVQLAVHPGLTIHDRTGGGGWTYSTIDDGTIIAAKQPLTFRTTGQVSGLVAASHSVMCSTASISSMCMMTRPWAIMHRQRCICRGQTQVDRYSALLSDLLSSAARAGCDRH